MKVVIRTFSFLLLAAAMAGCNASDSAESGGSESLAPAVFVEPADPTQRSGLLPQSRPLVEDVPVPMEVVLVESVSRRYESAAGRYVDLTYEGKVEKAAVERFYRERMEAHGWSMRGGEMIRGVFTLSYEKDNELATIRITDAPAAGNTLVAIDVHPVR